MFKNFFAIVLSALTLPLSAAQEPRLLKVEDIHSLKLPRFSPDGRSILFLLEDGGNVHLARVPAAGGAVERIVSGEREVVDFDQGPKGEIAVLETGSTYPQEISAVDPHPPAPSPTRTHTHPGEGETWKLRRLTHVNDEVLAGLRVAETRRLKVKSALSPFFQVTKIETPLLLLCAGNDVNVPCLNSEQLYQALRRLGRSTELVIYPGQGHGLTRPSFLKDRFERSLAWYDKHVRSQATLPDPLPTGRGRAETAERAAGGGR